MMASILSFNTTAWFFCESMAEATAGGEEEEDPPTDLITASTEPDLDHEKCPVSTYGV